MKNKLQNLLENVTVLTVVTAAMIVADVLSVIGAVLIYRAYQTLEGPFKEGMEGWLDKYGQARSIGYNQTHLFLIIGLIHLACFLILYVRSCAHNKKNIIPMALGIILTVAGYIMNLKGIGTPATVVAIIGLISLVIAIIFMWISSGYDDSRAVLIYWIISLGITCILIPFLFAILLFIIGLIVGKFFIAFMGGNGNKTVTVIDNETGEVHTYNKKDEV